MFSRLPCTKALLAGLLAMCSPIAVAQAASITVSRPIPIGFLKPVVGTVAETAPVWFAKPDTDVLRNSAKKVFAHYVPNFPLMIDFNVAANDYYTTQYLNPAGENDKFLYCGGFLRDRPQLRDLTGLTWPNFEIENDKHEIRTAISAGIDGFDYDLMASDEVAMHRIDTMLDAATQTDPEFKIILKPDMTCEFGGQPENLVPAVVRLARHPALLRTPDGRLVLSPYYAEARSPGWWSDVIAQLESRGVRIAFVPCVQGWGNYCDLFAPISYGVMNWSNLDPNVDYSLQRAGLSVFANFVWPQNFRPKDLTADEFGNSAQYRWYWNTMISQKVDWVTVATWNDYSETTHIAPSVGNGTAFLELTAYYATWFKTGTAPAIARDALLYFHRSQSVLTPSTLPQKSQIVVATGKDDIEALTFLKSPAVLQVKIGDKVYVKDLPAGMNSFRVPLQVGVPIFRITRGESVVLEGQGQRIFATVPYQDMQYKAGVILGNEIDFTTGTVQLNKEVPFYSSRRTCH